MYKKKIPGLFRHSYCHLHLQHMMIKGDLAMRYRNPWKSFQPPRAIDFVQSLFQSEETVVQVDENSARPNVYQPSFGSSKNPQLLWLGHASVYLVLPQLGILFDPMFSTRCSPLPFIGPRRRLDPPCAVSDLPRVDFVVISHDHYDHLDKSTIQQIKNAHESARYIVPSGLKVILAGWGIPEDSIIELGWWDEVRCDTTLIRNDHKVLNRGSISSEDTLTEPLRFICTPAQQNSGRSLFHQNRTLWSSWLVECPLPTGKVFRCFFGGDTGYRSKDDGPTCPIFKEIFDKYGAPDIALLPVASGSVLPCVEYLTGIRLKTQLTRSLHCSPEDAVEVHLTLQAKRSMAIHWGTFATRRNSQRTIALLKAARVALRVGSHWHEQHSFVTADIGEWLDLGDDNLLSCDRDSATMRTHLNDTTDQTEWRLDEKLLTLF